MKPRGYWGRKAREIRFPLGGIGTGCVSLGGAGHLVDWELFHRPAKNTLNGFSHFAVKAEARGRVRDARVLHGDTPPPYSGTGPGRFSGLGFGVARETLSGLPHFRDVVFEGGFPIATLHFRDPAFPGRVTLTAFNPFIPLNDADSSLPAAFFTVAFENPTRQTLDYTAAFTLRNPAGALTTNRLIADTGTRMLHLTGNRDPAELEYGDFAVATDATDAGGQAYWFRGQWFDNLEIFWRDFSAPGGLPKRQYATPGQADHGTLTVRLRVPAGQRGTCRFVFAWHVPQCPAYWKTPPTEPGAPPPAPPTWTPYYATRFADAPAVAHYALDHWSRLETETRRFRDTLFASTLPPAALDAISANLATLKTPTVLRLTDGSIYGWEGCHTAEGCCEGTCTHVWNYAYAVPFLFPALERGMRELEYRYNLLADGGMPFRLQVPLGRPPSTFRPCADGQFGGVLKVYREWKISGDTAWMRRLWPAVRQSIAFAWAPTNADRWDPARTGVLHGRQHHTLDMELFGPNAWLTGLYQAALKAGAEMAEACDEPRTAAAWRAMLKRGQDWVRRELFNGEYFVQRFALDDAKALRALESRDPKLREVYWNAEHGEWKYQLGEGCGIDQVLAQWHADLIGLGDVFDRAQTRRTLQAIYRHNYRPSLRNLVNPCRVYGLDDEAGTLMFTWPRGRRRPAIPVPYATETMHGFEYQAASHLIMHGEVDAGMAMVKAVRDRYDGERRNPWNEIECGNHYARSMASYALLPAFSGFRYDLTRGLIGFRPVHRPNGRFRCFWALGTAWGDMVLDRRGCRLRVLAGELTLQRLDLPLTGRGAPPTVRLGARILSTTRDGHEIVLAEPTVLRPGRGLVLSVR